MHEPQATDEVCDKTPGQRPIWRRSVERQNPTERVIEMTLPDLSAPIARMDQDDLATLADVLPSMKWQAPEGSEQRTWAENLMRLVIVAQEVREDIQRKGSSQMPS